MDRWKEEWDKDLNEYKKETKNKGGIKEIVINKEDRRTEKNTMIYLTITYNNGDKMKKEYLIEKINDKYFVFYY